MTQSHPQSQTFTLVDPNTVQVGPNVRLDPRLDQAFLASVRERGVLEPVLLYRADDGTPTVLAGQRCTLAAQQTGQASVAAAKKAAHSPGLRGFADQLTLDQAAVLAEFDDDPQAVEALLDAAPRGRFDHVAQRLHNDRAETAARAAFSATLTGQGVTVVDQPSHHQPGPVPLNRLTDPDGHDLTVEGHASCPGHAAYAGTEWRHPHNTDDTDSAANDATDDPEQIVAEDEDAEDCPDDEEDDDPDDDHGGQDENDGEAGRGRYGGRRFRCWWRCSCAPTRRPTATSTGGPAPAAVAGTGRRSAPPT